MALKSANEYRESLRSLHPDLWVAGKQVDSIADEPLLAPGVNALAMTYELAARPDYGDIFTVKIDPGVVVNRMAVLDRSPNDLLLKLEACRLLCQATGCAQRYLMHDAFGALSEVTWLIDHETDTEYFRRLESYMSHIQSEDLVCAVAMTDPKGDRSLRPHEQTDQDMYLHVVDRRPEGIVVRGAKLNITGAPYCHDIIVLPTRSMDHNEAEFAVSFALPIDSEGLRIISKPAGRPGDAGSPFSSQYGQSTAMLIFNDVLVPWERVFLDGEWNFAGHLAEAFADHHRHSCIGCRAALGDMVIGAATEMVEANGLSGEVSHLRNATAELIAITEGWYATGVAASVNGRETKAGTWVPDSVYSNVGKLLLARQVPELFRLAQELAGGIVATVPTPEDVTNPENKQLIEKYLVGGSDGQAQRRIHLARFLRDLTASDEAGWYSLISLHGGGSPEAMRRTAVRNYDFSSRRELARTLAHLDGPGGSCGGCGACDISPSVPPASNS